MDLIVLIALILVASVLAMSLAQLLRMPSIPLLVLAGVGLSITTQIDSDALLDTLFLGLTFLVFLAGTELNPQRIGAQRGTAIIVGLAQFFLLGTIGFGVARLVGFSSVPALYIALALTSSSTLIVVNLLRQRQQAFEPFGRLVLGVLLLQDLLVVLLLPGMMRIDEGAVGIAMGTFSIMALLILAIAGMKWVTPYLLQRLRLNEEAQLLTVLGILFFFLGLAYLFDLPLVAGAFLAGMCLSPFPISGLIRGQLSSLSDFFLAIFFVTLGAFLGIPQITLNDFLLVILFTLVILVLTPPLVTFIAERAGLSARASIESGLLLAQCSEFSLIVALLGLQMLGDAQPTDDGQRIFTIIALFTIITMILAPFIATDRMTWTFMRWHPSTGPRDRVDRPADHVLLLGCGANGLRILQQLIDRGERVVVVDDDPAVVSHVRNHLQVDALRGDGADYLVLRSAGARNAKVIISTMRRLNDHQRMLSFARNVPALVRVFTPQDGHRIRELGGTPIVYADAAAEDFLKWFDSYATHIQAKHSA